MREHRRPRIVSRPDFKRTGGRAPKYPYDALMATLDTETALRIPYDGAKPESVVSALTKAANRRGLRFRHRRKAGSLDGWVERRGTEKTA